MYKVIVTTAKGKTSVYKTKRSSDVLFGETGYCLIDFINGCSFGYGTPELKELAKSKQSDIYINFAYTDYGGDFFDRVAIAYFKENHPDNIVYESTSWNGENAYIFGEIAKEFKEATDNYLLGFEDIEDYYYEKEQEMLD